MNEIVTFNLIVSLYIQTDFDYLGIFAVEKI